MESEDQSAAEPVGEGAGVIDSALERPSARPQDSTLAFAQAINGSDVEAATSYFTRDACLITPDMTEIRGSPQIRLILSQMIARRTQIAVRESSVLAVGDVAIASERWRIRSLGAEGTVFQQSTRPTVLLKLVEGTWRLAIAAPWGWGFVESEGGP